MNVYIPVELDTGVCVGREMSLCQIVYQKCRLQRPNTFTIHHHSTPGSESMYATFKPQNIALHITSRHTICSVGIG